MEMRVLGLDPGYGLTGWGLIENGASANQYVPGAYGALATSKDRPMPERLCHLYDQLVTLLGEHKPTHVVIEELFVNRNISTAGEVYQARGILLLAVQQAACPIVTLNPARIKQMITGNGRASKREVTLMVQRLLGIKSAIRPDDAADALAGALAGAFLVRAAGLSPQLSALI